MGIRPSRISLTCARQPSGIPSRPNLAPTTAPTAAPLVSVSPPPSTTARSACSTLSESRYATRHALSVSSVYPMLGTSVTSVRIRVSAASSTVSCTLVGACAVYPNRRSSSIDASTPLCACSINACPLNSSPRRAPAIARFANAHDQPQRGSQWVGTALTMLSRTIRSGSGAQRTAMGAQRMIAPLPARDPLQALREASVTLTPFGFRALPRRRLRARR